VSETAAQYQPLGHKTPANINEKVRDTALMSLNLGKGVKLEGKSLVSQKNFPLPHTHTTHDADQKNIRVLLVWWWWRARCVSEKTKLIYRHSANVC
jgi:hypothetical protein